MGAAEVAVLDRLVEVRDVIRDHPEAHDQRNVACGTTACVAGWAIAQEVARLDGLDLVPGITNVEKVVYSDGGLLNSSLYDALDADRLLGLDFEEASWLFDPVRTRNEVLDELDRLIERASA
jgi:hypothetical protein